MSLDYDNPISYGEDMLISDYKLDYINPTIIII
jgi:hypothetical protein